MFSQEYQDGVAGVEVFSASGKSPGRQWKVSSSVHRVYDKTVKGFVFLLDRKSTAASSSPMMQVPPSPSKHTLGLTQRHLIFQLRLLAKKSFTVEINILSLKDSRQRYRLHLSTKFRTVEVHQMHVQIPLSPLLTPDTWTHLIIDVAYLTSFFFKNRDFGSIDSLNIHSGCRLRKVFTLPALNGGGREDKGREVEDLFYFHCPHNFDFPVGTNYEAKVLDISCFGKKGVFSIEVQAEDTKDSDAKSIPRKAKTPQCKPGSKSIQPEAFENGLVDQVSQVKATADDQDSTILNQPSSSAIDIKSADRRRKGTTTDTKKEQLLALNSKRLLQQQQHADVPPANPVGDLKASPSDTVPPLLHPPTMTSTTTYTTNTTSFYSPVKGAYTQTAASSTMSREEMVTMMSIEHALPTPPKSPITSQHPRVQTTEFVWSPVRCSNSSSSFPGEAIAGRIHLSEEVVTDDIVQQEQGDEHEEEQRRRQQQQESENEFSVETMTSQDFRLEGNNTIFTFATTAKLQAYPKSCIEDTQNDDLHSESTASFTFDREEEFKVNDDDDDDHVDDHVDEIDQGKEEEEERAREGERNDITEVEGNVMRHHPSSPVRCASPSHSQTTLGSAGSTFPRRSQEERIQERENRNASSRSSSDRLPVSRRSRVQRDFQRLKDHFNDLKFEFVEEYGEQEAARLLRD